MDDNGGDVTSQVWATLPRPMTDDKVTKAEFVWLMIQLAEADRAKFRELRELGWREAIEAGSVLPKSDSPN
jgi:hypothetical protein